MDIQSDEIQCAFEKCYRNFGINDPVVDIMYIENHQIFEIYKIFEIDRILYGKVWCPISRTIS